MQLDQVELMNKINRLERDLLLKEKEYKLMSARIRETAGAGDLGVRIRRKSLV
jgi:hypothetical protein